MNIGVRVVGEEVEIILRSHVGFLEASMQPDEARRLALVLATAADHADPRVAKDAYAE